MSPARNNLPTRVRNFPTLVNNIITDWLNEWPKKILLDVTKHLLTGVEFDDIEFRDQLANIFYEFHQIANIS
jgi:hypothetical protein